MNNTPTQIIVELYREISEQLGRAFYAVPSDSILIDIIYNSDSNWFNISIRVDGQSSLTGTITWEFIQDVMICSRINPYVLIATHIVQKAVNQKNVILAGFDATA